MTGLSDRTCKVLLVVREAGGVIGLHSHPHQDGFLACISGQVRRALLVLDIDPYPCDPSGHRTAGTSMLCLSTVPPEGMP